RVPGAGSALLGLRRAVRGAHAPPLGEQPGGDTSGKCGPSPPPISALASLAGDRADDDGIGGGAPPDGLLVSERGALPGGRRAPASSSEHGQPAPAGAPL